MSDPAAQPAGLDGELSNPDPAVRRRALLTLAGAKRDRALLDAFLRVAQNDPEPPLRLLARQLYQEARNTLGETGALGQSLIDVSTGEFDTRSLEHILERGESSAKLEAIAQATKVEDPKALAIFRRHLGSERDPWVLASLLKGLGTLGDSSDIHLVQPFLKHEDLRIQANAIEALELIGDELSFSLVAPMLQSTDPRIRANAIKCLVRFDAEEAIDTLSRMAEADQVESRESAVYCLGIVAHARVPGIVAQMVASETQEELLRKQLTILGEEGGAESVGPLAALRETLSGEFQTLAAMALGRIRGRVDVSDEEVERARAEFQAEYLRAPRHRRGALAALAGEDEDLSSSGAQAMRSVSQELADYQRKRRRGAAAPEEEVTGAQQVLRFFRENPSFAGLTGLTGAFLLASVALFVTPGPAAPTPPPRPTTVASRAPIQPQVSARPPPATASGDAITLDCTVSNIDPVRKTALLKHDGNVLSVRLTTTPPEGINRNDKVQIRGNYTGKTRFGAKEFLAESLRKSL